MPYRQIDPDAVIETIHRLGLRIAERFPGRGLNGVCADLLETAKAAQARVRSMQQPWLWVRGLSLVLAALGLVGLIAVGARLGLPLLAGLREPTQGAEVLDLVSGVEAAVNILILGGAAIFFILRHEERSKRALALAALHELRSLAHVVDMHQLTKDPVMMLNPERRTVAAPKDVMTAFELSRYLDYCSELLALIGKCAALYAAHTQDALVIEAVNDVEDLTTNLSRKIWQKIAIVSETGSRPAI